MANVRAFRQKRSIRLLLDVPRAPVKLEHLLGHGKDGFQPRYLHRAGLNRYLSIGALCVYGVRYSILIPAGEVVRRLSALR